MYELKVRGVHDGLCQGVRLLNSVGQSVSPRGMKTVEVNVPVLTTYSSPEECVLGIPRRDTNVFFHLFEALWILAGREDVGFLDLWNKQMKNYSDDGETFHAAYGYRLRKAYGMDQLSLLHNLFLNDPETRQGVLAIWSPVLDLNQESKDIPCNDLIFVKVRNGALHMRVFCRSNDIIWGCYGTNAVQFSFIHQYLACRLGVKLGTLTQFSDSFHAYCGNDQSAKMWDELTKDCSWIVASPYTGPQPWKSFQPLVVDWKQFDIEVKMFCHHPFEPCVYHEPFFDKVAYPMARLWQMHQEYLTEHRPMKHSSQRLMEMHLEIVPTVERFKNTYSGVDTKIDWIAAGLEWVERRES